MFWLEKLLASLPASNVHFLIFTTSYQYQSFVIVVNSQINSDTAMNYDSWALLVLLLYMLMAFPIIHMFLVTRVNLLITHITGKIGIH